MDDAAHSLELTVAGLRLTQCQHNDALGGRMDCIQQPGAPELALPVEESQFRNPGTVRSLQAHLQIITLHRRTIQNRGRAQKPPGSPATGFRRWGGQTPRSLGVSECEPMRNITVSVSDQAYRQARIWAAQRDTSVSAVVQYLLQTLPGMPRAEKAFPEAKPDQNTPAVAH